MTASRSRVVIIGGNFAGLVAASRLSCEHDVTVVDARADFEWTPNIHEILSGVKNRDGVVLPRAECVSRYGHTFVHDARYSDRSRQQLGDDRGRARAAV